MHSDRPPYEDAARSRWQQLSPQNVIGLFLMLLGALLLLDRFDLFDGVSVHLIPALLIALGVSILARRGVARPWGWMWIALGAWMLLNTFGWIRVGIGELIVPLVLILIGARVMRRTWPEGVRATPSDSNGRMTLFAFMSGAKRSSADKPFRGGEMTAIMGGCEVDLRQAEIAPGGQTVIELFTVMGGHELWVPPHWTVASDVALLLSGLEDKRLPPLQPPGVQPPRLLLRGFAFMGGIEIKS